MKKLILGLLILCVSVTVGFEPAPLKTAAGYTPPPAGQTVGGGTLIPDGARTMTVAYQGYNADYTKPVTKSYKAADAAFLRLCNFIRSQTLVKLTGEDLFSFTAAAYKNAAYISVIFDKGDPLYIYTEGGLSRFIDNGSGLPEPDSYYLPPDTVYSLEQILIPDFEKGYTTVFADSSYQRPADVNPAAVDEIPLYMPTGRTVFPLPDGFVAFNSVWGGSDTDCFLRAVKYDPAGNFVWMQNYTGIPAGFSSPLITACIPTKNGGFAFAAGALAECGGDGGILWQKPVDPFFEGYIMSLSETPDGSLLAAGNCQTDNDAHNAVEDLLLIKYGQNGHVLQRRQFGGSDFDWFNSACYSPEIGWVVLGQTQSSDGDFTARRENGSGLFPQAFITVFDDNLNVKWQYIFVGDNNIGNTHAIIQNGKLYVAGNLPDQTAVFKFDAGGSLLKSTVINAKFVTSLAAAPDGTLLISMDPAMSGEAPGVLQIYKLDNQLNIIRIVDDLKGNGYGYQVIPTNDGGFFTLITQTVKTPPHLPDVNFVMNDTATVLSRYDAAGNLICRKTYDGSHDTETGDKVIPLPDGRVIVGR